MYNARVEFEILDSSLQRIPIPVYVVIFWAVHTTVKFDADFSEIEGREQEFLDECSRKLGVRCVGVRQGSIILDVEGDPEQTSNALKELENGLDLDGFDPLPVPVILSQSPTAAPITRKVEIILNKLKNK